MTASVDVMLTVNGETRALRIEPFETLLTSLRDRLRLTAAKRGCNQGVCGACSVLIGGEPARACLSLTANCVDHEITTVEGLSTPLALSPLQAAMVRGRRHPMRILHARHARLRSLLCCRNTRSRAARKFARR